MKKDDPGILSHEYVFNYIFKKLSDTFDKYRHLLPSLSELEGIITPGKYDNEDLFTVIIKVLAAIKRHTGKSPLYDEILENVRKDFWHGLDPKKTHKHQGKYYIDSVAD